MTILTTQGGTCDDKNDPLGDRITRILLLLSQDPFLLYSLLPLFFSTSLPFSTTSFLPLFSSLLPLSYLSSLLSYLFPTSLLYSPTSLLYSPTSLIYSTLLPTSLLYSSHQTLLLFQFCHNIALIPTKYY